VIAKLTARTAVSALSAIPTALSVTRSALSSCAFTRCRVPPLSLMTGSTSRSSPPTNDVSFATVPPRRMSR
jgi:hypothetical protein